MDNSQVIFITHPYYAVNNPSNNYRLYFKRKRSDNWYYIQCKNKEEYRKKLNEYVIGFFPYSMDKDKAYTDINDMNITGSMFDYFMGDKKDKQLMEMKNMKTNEMAMLKDGTFLTEKDVPSIQKRWSKYIEDSNLQSTVLSFNKDYIDKYVSIKEFQKTISTDIMPKFLKYCGYKEPKKNLEWVVALHADRDDNYHFHISWVEKNKCYLDSKNNLSHRIKLKLSDQEFNYMKRQASLSVERNKLYKPALIKLEKDFQELQKYFKTDNKNFSINNIDDLILEEKIVKLGYLLNQVRTTNKNYIKYKSIPNNEIGKEIRRLTNDIKRELFKDKNIKNAKKQINRSINKINDILLDIDKRNNISKIGFESALDNKMIKGKLDRNEAFILNAIANHALYNFDFHKNKIRKDNFTLQDVINEVAHQNYIKNYSKVKSINELRTKLIKNSFKNKKHKNEMNHTLNKLIYEQKKVADLFYEMFEEEDKEYEKEL